MSQPLSHDSRYRPAAARFGAALDKRMRERRIGAKTLGPQCKVAISAIAMYRGARNFPSLPVAERLATALDAPELLEIVRKARTRPCRHCGREFVGTFHTVRYCSLRCRTLGAADSGRSSTKPEQAVMILRGELLRVGPVRKQSVGKALTLLDDALAPVRQAEGLSEAYAEAVAAMCAACEPEGLCRTAECPLRPVSPLPMAGQRVDQATPAAGRWGRPGAAERHSEAMRRRHADPHDPIHRGTAALRDPEVRKRAVAASVAATHARSFEDRSAAARRAWKTRKAKAA